jgi:putative redox protein
MPTTSTLLATFVDPMEGLRVTAVSGSGFPVSFDTLSPEEGGTASSPTETVLAALAACTAMDVASILRKKRQPFDRYQISVSATRADRDPKVFTSIVVEHQVSGDVSAEALRRSIELSATAYCPVSAMLSASVPIEHRYAIRRGGDGDGVESELVVATGPVAR